MQQIDLENLRVIDVIQMPEFTGHITECMAELDKFRDNISYLSGNRQIKRTPIDRLIELGEYIPEVLVSLYADAFEKKLDKERYPAGIRAFIIRIGDEAFYRTMNHLKQTKNDEKDA